jgi:hypothetical protein
LSGRWAVFLCFPVSPILRFLSCCAACPDQKASVFVSRQPLGADEFFLKVFEIRIIKVKPPL